MKKIKILLIRPKPPRETIGLQHVMICEPLELEYVAGNLDKNSTEVEIVDMILEKKSPEYFLKKYNPDIVGMTGYITHIGVIKDLARRIKNVNDKIITVVGGVHAEVNPKDFVSEHIDFIISEEPIATFLRIVDWRKNNPFQNAKASEIRGAYAKDKEIKQSAKFSAQSPDRTIVSKYRKKYYYMFHNPCALIKTSFGCPFKCSFCFCKEVTGGDFFERDIFAVVDEIQSIPEEEIYIVDDDFLFNKKRLAVFCDELEKRNINKKFLVYGRADFIANNEDMIKRLSQNGLRAVIVGIESVREDDLDKFNKKSNVTNSDIAIEILRKYGVELYATMILQPDFSRADFDNLIKFLIDRKVIFANLQPLTPLPGTDIFDDYAKKILVDREDYAKWDLAHVVLQPTKMSIRRYYYEIIRAYFKIAFRKYAIVYMIKKYGFFPVLKMWWGSQLVSLQYIKKMILGK